MHRPTFVKEYAAFWQDPSKVEVEWLALLFIIMALGIFFSTWAAPHELQADSTTPALDRFKQYRSAAGWALVVGKYTFPGPRTLQPFLLYVESEFLLNRAAQTSCWLLSGVCLRIMLKMGLHREPSKLANISPFAGEMRRRMWNLAVQLDLIVSFHMGLPSMVDGIESDCSPPRNLVDEDFGEDSPELPPGRPLTEYTHMSYPVFKSIICRCFGQVARLSHSLTLPTYSEVMRTDSLLQERWNEIPAFMKPRPLEDCVIDPPMQVIQRFGIASLYQKSRCVLHRRYLVEVVPKKEHDSSRRTCLQAALSLLDYQNTIYLSTQPGGMLSQNGWFVTGLAMHDFLLAAMIVYVVVQNDSYSKVGGNYDWTIQDTPLPDKDKLVDLLRRSYEIWLDVSLANDDCKKAAIILEVMLRKIQTREDGRESTGLETEAHTNGCLGVDNAVAAPMLDLAIGGECALGLVRLVCSGTDVSAVQAPLPGLGFTQPTEPQIALLRHDLVPNAAAPTGFDSWIPMTSAALDWVSMFRSPA